MRSLSIVESHTQDMYKHRVVVIVNDILAASGLFLQRFLGMMLGTRESIYWRTFVVLEWLDHWE
jgi:hypothetical protein